MRIKLSEMMKLRRVSQSEVAKGLDISRSAVSTWIHGRPYSGKMVPAFPNPEMLDALCLFFECEPNDLFELEAHSTPTGLKWSDFEKLVAA